MYSFNKHSVIIYLELDSGNKTMKDRYGFYLSRVGPLETLITCNVLSEYLFFSSCLSVFSNFPK